MPDPVPGRRGLDYRSVVADLSATPFPVPVDTPVDVVDSSWVRLPEEAQRRASHRECRGVLRPGGSIVIVAGGAVTSAEQEREEWGVGLRWRDLSTEEQVRLVGVT